MWSVTPLTRFSTASRDPLLGERLQFLLGTFHAPMAFRRSMFLAIGGFDEPAAGASDMLLEYELCRRLWLSGLQVSMAQVHGDYRSIPAHKSEFMDLLWREQAVGDLYSHVFSADLESRIRWGGQADESLPQTHRNLGVVK